jgi:hypothetical protein
MTTSSTGKGCAVLAATIKIPHFVSDERGKYRARTVLTEDQIIKAAKTLLDKQFSRGDSLTIQT